MSRSGGTIRIYTPYFPFPTTEGAFQVIYDQARVLVDGGADVELVCWKDTWPDITRKLALPAVAAFDPRIRIAALGRDSAARAPLVDPRRDDPVASVLKTGAGGLRRAARVGRALLAGWASPELFHYPHSADPTVTLPPADVGIYHYSFSYAWLARRPRRPEAAVFVHVHNLESALSALRARSGARGPAAWLHRRNAALLAAHERGLGAMADELWFLSEEDLRRWRAGGGTGRARLVPPTFDLAGYRGRHDAARSPGEQRNRGGPDLGFLGACDFEPNRLSLEWIVRSVAPVLAEHGFRGRVLVAGRGVPVELRREGDRYGFFDWLGFVPDLEEFWRRLSFLLVPQTGGSGVRIKLLEAIASGVPVLANREAVAPLAHDLAVHPLIETRDDPREWADRIMAETEPLATRRALAGHGPEGTSLNGTLTYRFLLESLAERRAPAG